MLFELRVVAEETEVIGLIDDLRLRLRRQVAEPRRWSGTMRRLSFARAIQGSNSIEGYVAELDDVVAAMDDEESLDADTETRLALQGYRDAMTYVLQLARDPSATIDESLVKSLHFMMLKYDLSKNPGRWRPGAIFVRREADDEIVYEGPDVELVAPLMGELVTQLATSDDPTLVRGALAHLNLVMIHPFSDGNGRMARCVQSLTLARDQILSPEFNSIEEYLGRNTQAYYDILAETGRGGWHPERSARGWVRFCLTAHYRQARTLLRRIEESEQLWDALTQLAAAKSAPERSVAGLYDASIGFRLRNASYRSAVASAEGEDITDQTASRDLKILVDTGLLEAFGEKRGRYYRASKDLLNESAAIRSRRRRQLEDDPFEIVAARAQPQLPL